MINKTIAEYLTSHKRLVIPQLGAFIHKEPQGDVVFVPFLKKDDGVFVELLCSQYNIDAADAQAMITEYVAQIRAGVETQGRFEIEGLGSIRTDSNGIYLLERNAPVQSGAPIQVTTPIPTTTPATPVTPPVPATAQTAPVPATPQTPAPSANAPRPAVNPIPRPMAPTPQPTPAVQPASTSQPASIPQPTSLPPRPSTPGTPSYTQSARAQAPTRPRMRPQAPPQKTDRFMLIAILAAAIALAAIVYGVVWGSNSPDINLIEMPAHQAADSLQTADPTTPASQQ